MIELQADINQYNLEKFYQIQDETGEFTKPITDLNGKNFEYLDLPETEKKYVTVLKDSKRIEFYLEGIHCLACIWLIEKLTAILPQVKSTRLNIEKSVVTIELSLDGKCSQIAATLNSLGYTPTPISGLSDQEKLQKKEERRILMRIGVAGACAMNIMLYSLGIYAGAEGHFSLIFSHLSLLLSLPVMTYSAWPFYKSAFAALKNKNVNLDVPLSFALIAGFSLSIFYTLKNSPLNYFDSISTLVFLILLSRYLLKKAQQNSLKATNLSSLFGGSRIIKIVNGRKIEVEEDQLNVNDTLYIDSGDFIPADGEILKGTSKLGTSSLTGESNLLAVQEGSFVNKGMTNQGNPFVMKVSAVKENTLLGKILSSVESNLKKRPDLIKLTDKVSHYFIISVLTFFIISLITFYFTHGLDLALQRSLAFIIVTCPCALGLATPLAFSRALKQAAKLGIIKI